MVSYTDNRIEALEQQLKLFKESSRQSDLVRKRYQDALSILKQKDLELKQSKQLIEKDLDMLKAMQQQLVEKEKLAALGSLVAGVAHEVNTPIGVAMTSISACSEEIRQLKKSYQAEELSESEMDAFFETVDESMRLAKTGLDQAARLISSFKMISVDRCVRLPTGYHPYFSESIEENEDTSRAGLSTTYDGEDLSWIAVANYE